jgi:hypothetical protein
MGCWLSSQFKRRVIHKKSKIFINIILKIEIKVLFLIKSVMIEISINRYEKGLLS